VMGIDRVAVKTCSESSCVGVNFFFGTRLDSVDFAWRFQAFTTMARGLVLIFSFNKDDMRHS
jgi:hypothetical protein